MPQETQRQTQGTQPDPETDPRDRDWEPPAAPTTLPTTPPPPIEEPPPYPGGGDEM